jgi:hypothetical protein
MNFRPRLAGFIHSSRLPVGGKKMKRLLICAAAVLTAVGAHAAENGPGRGVCVQNRESVNIIVMVQAQALVTAVFAEAGVRIEWLTPRQCRTTTGNVVLRIEVDAVAPAGFGREALAYALPYATSGTTIHVFYDRVLRDHRDLTAQVLGHVIAHEIGHVLEGIARHSPGGLMKAHWDASDFASMRKHLLSFAAEDVELMRLRLPRPSAAGLAARSEME